MLWSKPLQSLMILVLPVSLTSSPLPTVEMSIVELQLVAFYSISQPFPSLILTSDPSRDQREALLPLVRSDAY